MQVTVDDNVLKKEGYVYARRFTNIPVSYRFVSKLWGVSHNTVSAYAEQGLIKKDADGMISLADALTIDFNELRLKYLRER